MNSNLYHTIHKGITYFAQDSFLLAENLNNNQFRVLMKFVNIHNFVPTSASVTSADISLTFTTYELSTDVDICFIMKPWESAAPVT